MLVVSFVPTLGFSCHFWIEPAELTGLSSMSGTARKAVLHHCRSFPCSVRRATLPWYGCSCIEASAAANAAGC